MATGVRLGSSRGRWIVASMVLGSTITFLSATVVNVALPAIGTDLDAGLSGLQWVVNGYLLSLASLVLAGGSAGDLFGRRKVFVLDAALLTPTSLAIIDASLHQASPTSGCVQRTFLNRAPTRPDRHIEGRQ